MNCVVCGKVIPKQRLKTLPETETCVRCSEVKPVVGMTLWDKTTTDLVIVDNQQADKLRELENGRLNRI